LCRAIIDEMSVAESCFESVLKDCPQSQSHVKLLLARGMEELEQKLAEAEQEMRTTEGTSK